MTSFDAGARLGPYEIVSLLGRGGMGEVYKARDPRLDREVAIKVLPAELHRDETLRRRLEREARAIAQVQHPHVCTLYDIGSEAGRLYLVMEYLEGETLERRLHRGSLPLAEALRIGGEVAAAVAAAHRRGVAHRDLKPGNVILAATGAKVLDFGIAKAIVIEAAGHAAETTLGAETLTREGTIAGTVPYMAPEQLEGRETDGRADLWALGCMLYEMATGERPFVGRSHASLVGAILRDAPEPLRVRQPAAPGRFERIVAHCLEKDPQRRYQSAHDLAWELQDLKLETDSGAQGVAVRVAALPAAVGESERSYRTPMLGREEERAALRQALERAVSGRGGLVMLAGEPGVGKTRLAQELADEAHRRSVLTLAGHCYDMEGAPPYAPWVEILERAARIVPAPRLHQLLADGAPEVAKLLPELRRLYPDLAVPLELPPEQARHYLFRCVRELFERWSRAQPLVVVLEDLHWGDEATLLLLRDFAAHLREMPLLVVGTYRDVELEVARPLAEALRQLGRERQVERIALRRLPEAAVADMLGALSGRAPPRELVTAIHGATEGNPFFVEEVWLHLEHEGRLFDEGGRWRAALSAVDLDVPEGVRLAIGRRLERLSEDGRSVLAAAAVIGRRFGFDLLAAVSRLDPDSLLDAVERAERLALIEPAVGSEGREARFAFTHELIRQTLLGSLSLPRRQRMHLAVAEAIERLDPADLDSRAPVLAHHLYQAGAAANAEKTARFLLIAGNHALVAGAFEEAFEHFERALTLAPAGDRAKRADLLWKRGLARRSLGKWDEAIEDWRQALDLYEEVGERKRMPDICREMAYLFIWSPGPNSEAMNVARRGLAAVGPEPTIDRCRLLVKHAWASFSGSEMKEALLLAQALGDPQVEGEALVASSHQYHMSMRTPPALAAARRATDLLRAAGDLWSLTDALGYQLVATARSGRFDGMALLEDEAENLAERLGHRGPQVNVQTARAIREWVEGADIDRLESSLRRGLELCVRFEVGLAFIFAAKLAQASFWRGHWDEALAQAREAARDEPLDPGHAGFAHSILFRCESYAGNRETASAMLAEWAPRLPRVGRPGAVGYWEMVLGIVEGLATLDERDGAAELYPLAREAVATGTIVSPMSTHLIETVAGIAAAAGGQWDLAENHYQAAVRQAHEIPFRSEQPEVRRWYARMLLERDRPGDRERAATMLDEAVRSYAEIGMPRHLEMAQTLRTRL